MKSSKLLTVFLSIVTALFIVSFAIAVPIMYRPFYYAQIDMLDLVEKTDLTRGEIIQAYDEMLDYCIGVKEEFSTGVLKWSESGKSHFVDVRGLFILDLIICSVTFLILVLWMIVKRKINIKEHRFLGRGPATLGPVFLIVTFGLIGGLAALDFSRAFVVFHSIFFPGKDNWIFDYDTDQIIRILPEVFFRNCAILILAIIIAMCIVGIVSDCFKEKGKEKDKR